ncbi:iron-containing alcohol dehydrogenase [Bordetella sp. 02P26C-1]|uniref:iron-containing alcohol dehydrogenase n=1 Tax=Bordetella sp. 02P26C-1 TaxID=2683195 RepID=UPI001354D0D7|nr:iron-containing alcohol dehydrogenase [Bordetella sp. 02P26C-1]MVW79474.1 iron-containing alcohol dehydrogenase [Bordetella sp. 02P26C-1]
MQRFEFSTVPQLIVELGAAQRLGSLLRAKYKQTRLCLVTDKFLHQSGLLDPALSDLRASGWEVTVIDDVVADPPDHVVLKAVERARDARAEVVLGLGGGSSLDVAKLIAVLCGSDQPLSQMYGIGNVTGPRLPLVLMPTTAGTGSEVTAISIVTTGETTKSGVVSPFLMADVAILDAELTKGLPPAATAATGIDAMVHAIEAYTSARLKNPLSDMLAMQALRLLSHNLLPACRHGDDIAAREAMLLGATLAGQAFSNAPVAAVHALAYPLGGHYHVPHGLSNSLVLSHVLRFNLPMAQSLYAELAPLLPGDACPSEPAAAAQAFIERIEALVRETGIPCRLRDVGVTEDALPMLARDAMAQQRLLVNNPRPVTEADAFAIYQAAY